MNKAPTAEQLRGMLGNRAWRLCNLYTILGGANDANPDAPPQLVAYEPNHAQRRYHNRQHNLDAILKARKLGLSTHKSVEFCDFGMFMPRVTLGIIDFKLADAKEKLQMVKRAYENLDNGDIHPTTWRLGHALKRRNPLVTENEEALEWGNGARLSVSTTFRGRTPNKLHLSEFGSISAFRPAVADEIVNGAFNSVLPGQSITSESTHEPGRGGQHERLLKRAMANADLPKLSALDWRFHFFPWYTHPRYAVDPEGRPLRPEIERYFDDLAKKFPKLRFTPAQRFWYDRKQEEQGYGMKKEFPTTPGEALEALVKGAIWGREIADLRAAGRVTDLIPGPEPLYTFWDLGYSDYTAIWLIQLAGRDILVHRFHEGHRIQTGRYMEILRRWERDLDTTIAHHFLPHDAESHGGAGVSPIEALIAAGMSHRDITVVPRCQDPWVDINHARLLLARAYFDRTHTDTAYDRDGEERPPGLVCLANYKTSVTRVNDYETNVIVHDQFSHPADGWRTFAAAELHGLIKHAASRTTLQVTANGPSRFSPTHRRQ